MSFKTYTIIISTVLVLACALAIWFTLFRGSGGLTRLTAITGIYAICQPKGYDVVCFGDTAGKDGGVSCLPLSQVGGKCH